MIIYIQIGENGYIDGWGTTKSTDDDVQIELDKNHEFFKKDIHCWKYEDGGLVFDEERQQKLIEEYEREQNRPSEQERIEALENALLELILRGDNDD